MTRSTRSFGLMAVAVTAALLVGSQSMAVAAPASVRSSLDDAAGAFDARIGTTAPASQAIELGTISGVVRNRRGRPVPHVHVYAWQWLNGVHVGADGDYTDANGRYTIRGLRPGRYSIGFFDNDTWTGAEDVYRDQMWNGVRYTSRLTGSVRIRLRAGQDIGGVDDWLVRDHQQWGPAGPGWPGTAVGRHSVTLTWRAARSNGGPPVVDYVIQHRGAGSRSWRTLVDGTSTRTAATVRGLSGDVRHVFRVRARNRAGMLGPWSKVVAAVPTR